LAEIEIQGYSTVLCLSFMQHVDRILDQPWRKFLLAEPGYLCLRFAVELHVADEVFVVYLCHDFEKKVSLLHEVAVGMGVRLTNCFA